MARPARFTFDLDLAEHRSYVPSAGVPESLVGDLVRDAREEGFAEGRRMGEQSAANMAAQALAAAAASLAARAEMMEQSLEEARRGVERDGIGLARTIAQKLAFHLVAQEPEAELAALLADCMASIGPAPHLVVRCHPDLADAMREAAAANGATSQFSGRLVVLGDPDCALSDGRLEWVDGGLVRDTETIASDIDQRIAQYLAARANVNKANP